MGCISSQRQSVRQRQANSHQRTIQNRKNQVQMMQPQQNNIFKNNNQIQISRRYPEQVNQSNAIPIEQNQVMNPINRQVRATGRYTFQIPQQSEQQVSETIYEIQRRQQLRANEENENINNQNMMNNRNTQLDIQALAQNLFFLNLIRIFRNQNGRNQLDNLHRLIRLLELLQQHSSQNQGLNQNEIQKLRRKLATNNQTTCAVCQDNIKKGEQALILPCEHEFHPSCILPWFQQNQKCPLCRASARIN